MPGPAVEAIMGGCEVEAVKKGKLVGISIDGISSMLSMLLMSWQGS
jgi:hypothetical protein